MIFVPKKEKKISVSLSFPEYKLEALALALEEKGVSLEEELEQYLAKLYQKKVSADVRKFLAGKYKEYEQTTLVNTSQASEREPEDQVFDPQP